MKSRPWLAVSLLSCSAVLHAADNLPKLNSTDGERPLALKLDFRLTTKPESRVTGSRRIATNDLITPNVSDDHTPVVALRLHGIAATDDGKAGIDPGTRQAIGGTNFNAKIADSNNLLSVNAHALDLMQVYQEGLANDAQHAIARAALAAGQEREVQGRSGVLPMIEASGSRGRQMVPFVESIDNRRSYNKTYAISLTQPLYRMANWQTYQQGKLSVAASEAQFALAQQDLILRVAQAYFDVLAAEDALASVQAEKSAITEQLTLAKRNFEAGIAAITDTHEAQARYDLVIAQEFVAQNDLDIRRAALQQIIGRPAGDLVQLRPGLKLTPPQPAQLNEWVRSAEQLNYGVVERELAVQIAQSEIKRNRAGHYPTVDLEASRNYNSNGPNGADGQNGRTNSVAVRLNVPLFAGFAVDSRVREAIALEARARADLENARRTAAQGARQAFLGVNAGLAQIRALEAAEVSSQSALELIQLGYQVGVRINIDVLNAQQQLFSTRRDLARARYDTLLNGLRLKSAAGTLGEEDVAQVNTLLGR
jgi:outer membrane protein